MTAAAPHSLDQEPAAHHRASQLPTKVARDHVLGRMVAWWASTFAQLWRTRAGLRARRWVTQPPLRLDPMIAGTGNRGCHVRPPWARLAGDAPRARGRPLRFRGG